MRSLLFPLLAVLISLPAAARAEMAIFAGGCFWCMESEYQDLEGVSDVVSGYAGGPETASAPKPSYEDVGSGRTGFIEAVRVTYDPAVVGYHRLLDIFWRNVDPFDAEGQFCDKGAQYAAAIFYGSAEEEKLARASLDRIEKKFGREVATKIIPAATFHVAEDYHQDYYRNSAVRYKLYRQGCGRDRALEKIWSGEGSR